MAATESSMLKLGTSAPEFILPDTISGKTLSLNNCRGENGLAVFFICNHCPFVVHCIDTIVKLANKYQKEGVGFVAISSNNVEDYPQDGPEKMKEFAEHYKFAFPYLYDQTQQIAKAYQAECTPDNYLFDAELKLIYRGRLDDSRPNSGQASSGAEFNGALSALVAGQMISEIQYPSIGCNIKWKSS